MDDKSLQIVKPMDERTSQIVLINVIFLLCYIKFGTLFFWIIAVVGYSSLILFALLSLFLKAYAPRFYRDYLCSFLKRMTGVDFEVSTPIDKDLVRFKHIINSIVIFTVSVIFTYQLYNVIRVLPYYFAIGIGFTVFLVCAKSITKRMSTTEINYLLNSAISIVLLIVIGNSFWAVAKTITLIFVKSLFANASTIK